MRTASGLPLLLVACAPAPTTPVQPSLPRAISPLSAPARPVLEPVRAGFALAGDFSQGGLVRGRAPSGALNVQLDGTELELDPAGRFLFGLDRDAGQQATLVATLVSGERVVERLAIAPADWGEQRVNAAFRPGSGGDDDYAQRRAREVGTIAAARAIDTAATGWRGSLAWPVVGRISGRFGNQRVYRGGVRGSPHSGVDIAVPRGTPVLAPASGVVVLVSDGEFALEGNLLILDHGHGLSSAFLHLDTIDVVEGQAVAAGQSLATVGSTGRATGPHLHWTLRWNDQRLDPARAVERAGVTAG